MSRLDFIRNEGKKYHDYCYDQYTLFEAGSWLYKPVQTVMETLKKLKENRNPNVLDLGSGVGRNSIPIAQQLSKQNGQVICVDFLDSALEKLSHYSVKYDVKEMITPIKSDIAQYDITPNEFDYIVAVSSLEHVDSERSLDRVLSNMANGTKIGGINCMIINSDVKEIDLKTNRDRDALMEVNVPTKRMIEKLNHHYQNWNMIKHVIKPLEYEIVRNNRPVLLKTNANTYVVQKV
ncbi:class I SAM-dependent methyltransferase [Tenuibacillus multivorans]|uniref:Methyltransferase domain-containing protein n=1 Tax=Tenuibacillus multivorans TaxID=237069 RepID=A0A1H0DSA3_9BACI|nr:class I SAM-dependent methyltransferase [Tenuibacillus multivorans]GEL78825.1 methyltransferase [Tenuibacillus multivorans]SDN73070.1 Methyltransferase domain-containing protein [Tenuibacillus multivorans]